MTFIMFPILLDRNSDSQICCDIAHKESKEEKIKINFVKVIDEQIIKSII